MSVVLPLRGVTALSDFRVEKLLQKSGRTRSARSETENEFWYFVGSESTGCRDCRKTASLVGGAKR